MPYTAHTFADLTINAGTLRTALFYDSALGALTCPPRYLVNVQSIQHRLNINEAELIAPTMTLTVEEDYSVYLQGFWHYLITETLVNNYAAPELHLSLVGEGSVFWGKINLAQIKFVEDFVGTSGVLRSIVEIELESNINRLAEVPFTDWLNELEAQAVLGCPLEKVQIQNITAIIHGTGGTNTIGYRIAVQTATEELEWSDIRLVTGAANSLGGSNYIELVFPKITGATNYTLYRVSRTQGALVLGRLNINATDGGGTIHFDDKGEDGIGGAVQSRLSASMYIDIKRMFQAAVKLAFGYADYNVDYAPVPYSHLGCRFGSDWFFVGTNLFVLFKRNFGTITAPIMQRMSYFNSNDQNFYGTRFLDLKQLIGHLAKQFAYYPIHEYFDLAYHRIRLLPRGYNQEALTTMVGELTESTFYPSHNERAGSVLVRRGVNASRDMVITHVAASTELVTVTVGTGHAFLANQLVTITGVRGMTELNGKWTIRSVGATTFDLYLRAVNTYTGGGEATVEHYYAHSVGSPLNDKYDLELSQDFCILASGYSGHLYDYEQLYCRVNGTNGIVAMNISTTPAFFNRIGQTFEITATSMEAHARYLWSMNTGHIRMYERSFDSIKSIVSGGSAKISNTQLLMRMEINDGIEPRIFCATEIEIDLLANHSTITLQED